MRWTRAAIGCCIGSLALLVAGCAAPRPTPPAADLPLEVGHGTGSQLGNYAAQARGEMRGDEGERCVVFEWDRPLTKDLALRLRSASCESKERPGRMVAVDLGRTIIPLAESNVKAEPGETGR